MTETAQNVTCPKIINLALTNEPLSLKKLLITGEAKIDTTDEHGMTALCHCAFKGNVDVMKLLIEQGADVNIDTHNHRYYPLHFAALSGNVEAVHLLLNAGAKSYSTNTLGRTASQMAGFVGNHSIVAVINNYIPLDDLLYYTVPRGLSLEPILLPEVAEPLYNLIMQVNLHPVFIILSVERSSIIKSNLASAYHVLDLLVEKEAKCPENVNEVICLKLHYISYILKFLGKEKSKIEAKQETAKELSLIFENCMKKLLRERPSDGVAEQLELFIRDALRSFPYHELPLFMQIIRQLSGSIENFIALNTLNSFINSQSGFQDENVNCSACNQQEKDSKKCSKCKTVQYCDRTCQKLHWSSHKRNCEKIASELLDKVEK